MKWSVPLKMLCHVFGSWLFNNNELNWFVLFCFVIFIADILCIPESSSSAPISLFFTLPKKKKKLWFFVSVLTNHVLFVINWSSFSMVPPKFKAHREAFSFVGKPILNIDINALAMEWNMHHVWIKELDWILKDHLPKIELLGCMVPFSFTFMISVQLDQYINV